MLKIKLTEIDLINQLFNRIIIELANFQPPFHYSNKPDRDTMRPDHVTALSEFCADCLINGDTGGSRERLLEFPT